MNTTITVDMSANGDPALMLSTHDGTARLIVDMHHGEQVVLRWPSAVELVRWAERIEAQKVELLRFARSQAVRR